LVYARYGRQDRWNGCGVQRSRRGTICTKKAETEWKSAACAAGAGSAGGNGRRPNALGAERTAPARRAAEVRRDTESGGQTKHSKGSVTLPHLYHTGEVRKLRECKCPGGSCSDRYELPGRRLPHQISALLPQYVQKLWCCACGFPHMVQNLRVLSSRA